MRPEHRPRDDAPVGPFAQLADALRGMLATLHDLAAEVEAALEGRRELASTLQGMLRKLVDARAETEAALEREYELLRYVSHELRTPLTSALTNLEVLAAELQGEQAELAHAALHSTDRMVRLVEDLLLLSRAAGIPPGLEDRMFDRFARAAGNEAGGSGLGLAIVRAVAESHGGTVALERPASGRGAGFVVRIPALPPAARHGRAEGVRSVG